MCGISVGLFITTILSSTGKRSAEVQPLLCGATDGTEGVCNISAFCSFQESGFPLFPADWRRQMEDRSAGKGNEKKVGKCNRRRELRWWLYSLWLKHSDGPQGKNNSEENDESQTGENFGSRMPIVVVLSFPARDAVCGTVSLGITCTEMLVFHCKCWWWLRKTCGPFGNRTQTPYA